MRLAIVITVENEAKVSKLCVIWLWFDRALKMVEKYWETNPSLV